MDVALRSCLCLFCRSCCSCDFFLCNFFPFSYACFGIFSDKSMLLSPETTTHASILRASSDFWQNLQMNILVWHSARISPLGSTNTWLSIMTTSLRVRYDSGSFLYLLEAYPLQSSISVLGEYLATGEGISILAEAAQELIMSWCHTGVWEIFTSEAATCCWWTDICWAFIGCRSVLSPGDLWLFVLRCFFFFVFLFGALEAVILLCICDWAARCSAQFWLRMIAL